MKIAILVAWLLSSCRFLAAPIAVVRASREISSRQPLHRRHRLHASGGAQASRGMSKITTAVQIFNNVAGAGILTLSFGMRGVGWVPAITTCLALGAIRFDHVPIYSFNKKMQ